MPKVFIVVLNWQTYLHTKETLDSLREISYSNFEILLVDNGSCDGSAQALEEFLKNEWSLAGPKAHYIRNSANLGFAGGNNVGIKFSLENGADYILLLNSDVKVDKYFLEPLIQVGQQHPSVGILGPRIYFYDKPEKLWFAGGVLNRTKTKGTHLGLHEPMTEEQKSGRPYEVDYVTGCALLVKREVVEKIGLMPEDYFLFYEDADWSLRAKKAGYRIVVVPQSKIWHKESRSAVKGSYNYLYYMTRGGLMMGSRYASKYGEAIIYLISFWILAKQYIKLIINYRRDWARPVIRGILDFYRGKTGKARTP